MIPLVDCSIDISCSKNPSEDSTKLEYAITNIFGNLDIQTSKYALKASSKSLETLTKIHESITNHNTKKIYHRILNDNLSENSTWFYINKQAAFVNNVAVCEHEDESPLGPIKVILYSKNIQRIIEWLIS